MNGKAVLTVADAGGPLEFVTHGETGFISEPSPKALGNTIAQIAKNRQGVVGMADACRQRVQNISWASVASGLLGEDCESKSASAKRRMGARPPKITVALTFPVFPPRGGGQARVFHLYRNLVPEFEVDVVSVVEYGQPEFDSEIAPHLREIRIRKRSSTPRESGGCQRRWTGFRLPTWSCRSCTT